MNTDFMSFIDFLQDNFEHELYRNDVKAILDKLLNPANEKRYAEICKKYDIFYHHISNKLFLYAFFLKNFDINILPFISDGVSYGPNTFKSGNLQISLFTDKTISSLETFIIPGNCKNIEANFLNINFMTLEIKKLIIEEGIENIELFAFLNLKQLEEIYLPASLKNFGDVIKCPANLTIYYKPVLKENGKRGVGFKITSSRKDAST